MGFKISPRAIGFSAGLRLPFSIILALRPALRAEQSEPAATTPAGFFVCFVRALDPARDCGEPGLEPAFDR